MVRFEFPNDKVECGVITKWNCHIQNGIVTFRMESSCSCVSTLNPTNFHPQTSCPAEPGLTLLPRKDARLEERPVRHGLPAGGRLVLQVVGRRLGGLGGRDGLRRAGRLPAREPARLEPQLRVRGQPAVALLVLPLQLVGLLGRRILAARHGQVRTRIVMVFFYRLVRFIDDFSNVMSVWC